MNGCPFCPLERLTEWYLEERSGIVVCRDLHDRGYKRRLLVVGSGSRWHRPREEYTRRELKHLVALGHRIAWELITRGEASRIAGIDYEVSVMDHYHIQVCLT